MPLRNGLHYGYGVKRNHRRHRLSRKILASVLVACAAACTLPALAQNAAPVTQRRSAVPPELTGRTVEEIRIIGRNRPLSSVTISEVLRNVRTREGSAFEPSTVEADYQRIFGLRKFSNVEARVEPTTSGVIVIFEVAEQNHIKEIRYLGNSSVDTITLRNAVNMREGEGVDGFRIGLAREAIQNVYRNRNFPHVHVEIDQDKLAEGILVFQVIEGPRVRVRKVRVLGNRAFTDGRIEGQTRTRAWFPLFVPGRFDPDQLEQDVASIRQFYENKGFFDVRVGRKVVVSANQREVMIDFVVEEGQRYIIDKVSFKVHGSSEITEAQLRRNLKLIEGMPYDQDVVRRDVREIVRVYSPYGYIYTPADPNPDPEYMRIRDERYFRRDAGKVELVYNIHEGKPFRLGPVIIKGNAKTDQKVVLRELRVQPGQLYNSHELNRAVDRIRATNLFQSVTITPIVPPDNQHQRPEPRSDSGGTGWLEGIFPIKAADQPAPGDLPGQPAPAAPAPAVGVNEPLSQVDLPERALLIEVTETPTARFLIGAGLSSNSGVIGNITYEQRNFDITNWPSTPGELFTGRAFTGAGQLFRVQIEPGTELTRARVDFVEPWIFDQPYRLGLSGFISQRQRRNWQENRAGGRISLGRRFGDEWMISGALRGEDVEITRISRPELRAREIVELEGHSTITSSTLEVRHDTTDSPILPSRGMITAVGWEHYGTLGGDFDFDKFTVSWDWFTTIYEDLLDRRTILALHADAGYISGGAPFFERLYGGGIGSVRGFRYRGISPRSGIGEDPVGGDFMVRGSVELNFPLAADVLRGVVFFDAGTVERDLEIRTVRTSVGFGIRLTLPIFGQLPLALDFGFPLTRDDQDDTRMFSFALGNIQ
jgi:outer membrane protein insertion porin family